MFTLFFLTILYLSKFTQAQDQNFNKKIEQGLLKIDAESAAQTVCQEKCNGQWQDCQRDYRKYKLSALTKIAMKDMESSQSNGSATPLKSIEILTFVPNQKDISCEIKLKIVNSRGYYMQINTKTNDSKSTKIIKEGIEFPPNKNKD